jgi:hypothetical protein
LEAERLEKIQRSIKITDRETDVGNTNGQLARVRHVKVTVVCDGGCGILWSFHQSL